MSKPLPTVKYQDPWQVNIDPKYRAFWARLYWSITILIPGIPFTVAILTLVITGSVGIKSLVASAALLFVLMIWRTAFLDWIARTRFSQAISDDQLIKAARALKFNRVLKIRKKIADLKREADDLMQSTDREAIGDLMHKWHDSRGPRQTAIPFEARRLYGIREGGEEVGDE